MLNMQKSKLKKLKKGANEDEKCKETHRRKELNTTTCAKKLNKGRKKL